MENVEIFVDRLLFVEGGGVENFEQVGAGFTLWLL
jgi:hypothetical protein